MFGAASTMPLPPDYRGKLRTGNAPDLGRVQCLSLGRSNLHAARRRRFFETWIRFPPWRFHGRPRFGIDKGRARARNGCKRHADDWLVVAAALRPRVAASTDLGPSPAELKARWEAQNVYPQNYKNDLLAFLRTYLNDPTHMRGAMLSQPALKTVVRASATSPACATTRATRRQIYRRQGWRGDLRLGQARPLHRQAARREGDCKDAVYAPFPELRGVDALSCGRAALPLRRSRGRSTCGTCASPRACRRARSIQDRRGRK